MARRQNSGRVLERLSDLFVRRDVPDYIRSDNGPEFTATAARTWLAAVGVKTLFIELGSPWVNGYIESFNGKLCDELLNRELFLSVAEARWVVDCCRLDHNHRRPHSSSEYQTPAAFEAGCALPASATPQPSEPSRVT